MNTLGAETMRPNRRLGLREHLPGMSFVSTTNGMRVNSLRSTNCPIFLLLPLNPHLPTIAALPHEFLDHALSSAKTTRIDAPSISKNTRKSMLSHFPTVNLALRRLRIFISAVEKSDGRKIDADCCCAGGSTVYVRSHSDPFHLSLSDCFLHIHV